MQNHTNQTGIPAPEKRSSPPGPEAGKGEMRMEVPATVQRLAYCIRHEAVCPFCCVKIRIETYCDKQGFHAGSRSWGTRKCKHFYAFQGSKAIFIKRER
jgi:hypothetical protein